MQPDPSQATLTACPGLYGIEPVANVAGSGTWPANPGTVAALAAPATWILADLGQLRFDIRTLPGP